MKSIIQLKEIASVHLIAEEPKRFIEIKEGVYDLVGDKVSNAVLDRILVRLVSEGKIGKSEDKVYSITPEGLKHLDNLVEGIDIYMDFLEGFRTKVCRRD